MSNINNVETTITTQAEDTMNTNIQTIENEGQLLNETGHTIETQGNLPEGTTTIGNLIDNGQAKKPSEADLFFAMVSPHVDLGVAEVVASYPKTTNGAAMAAEEMRYRQNPKYSHLVFRVGSFVQAPESDRHPKFGVKLRALVLCPSSTSDNMIWVERASSDFWTFMGCEAYAKIVKKQRKAEKDLAALTGK